MQLIKELKSNFSPSFFKPDNFQSTKEYIDSWQWEYFIENEYDSLEFVISFVNIATEKEINQLLFHSESIDYSWLPESSILKEAPGGGGADDCDCAWDISCSFINMGFCEDSECDHTSSGCGLLWLSPCENRCDGEIEPDPDPEG